jgi:hypothetical protein
MPRERELDASLSPLAFFGAEVRRARTAAGMSLADMGRRPNVTLQVLADAGAHVGLQGAFTVAEVTGTACSVNMEDISDGRVCDDTVTVGTVSVRFRWLQSEAMSASASQAFIERMAEQWTQAAPSGARRLTPVPAAGSASK